MKIYAPEAGIEWPISTPEAAERWLMDLGLDQFDIEALGKLLGASGDEWLTNEVYQLQDALDERDEEISELQHQIVKLEQKIKELEA